MKIAQIAPITQRISPYSTQSTQRIIHTLTEQLVNHGHEVTLFATSDSKTNAKLASTIHQAVPENDSTYSLKLIHHLGRAYSQHQEFDLIHDHTGVFGVTFAHSVYTPTINTLHQFLPPEEKELLGTFSRPYLSTLSLAQRKSLGKLNNLGTVGYGLDLESYPPALTQGEYLLYIDEITPQFGAHVAIAAAKILKLPLILTGPLNNEHDHYFKTKIQPHLTDTIRYVPTTDPVSLKDVYQKAIALLYPVANPQQPFPLHLVEAMASGCPIIAFENAALTEIVYDGRTGCIVKNIQQMVWAAKKIETINRDFCKEYALTQFSAQKMVQGYEDLYLKVLKPKKESISRQNFPTFGQFMYAQP